MKPLVKTAWAMGNSEELNMEQLLNSGEPPPEEPLAMGGGHRLRI